VVALVAFLIFIAYNHEAIGCYLARTATTETRDRMVSSMGSTLRKSVGTLASLNDYPFDSMMLSSRTARGAAHMLGQMGAFMNDRSYSLRLQTLSARSYDMAWAKAHQAVAARGLRCSLITLWKQSNDFRDEDSVRNETQDRHHLTDEGTVGDNDWYSEIRVTDPSRGWLNHMLRDAEIEDYLLGLNTSAAANVRTGYLLTITEGGVASDGLQMWADTVARVGDTVTEWQRRLVRAQAMQSYVQGIDDRSYRNDMGYLQLRMSTQYVRARLNITADGADNFWWFDGDNLSVRSYVEAELERPDMPLSLYLGDGRYRVRIVGTTPGSETAWDERRVSVYPYYSSKFCSETLSITVDTRPIYFTIDDRLNGTVNLTVVCKDGANDTRGTLLDHRLFNASTVPSEKLYIDDSWIPGFDFDDSALGESPQMRESLTFTLYIHIGIDNGSDGSFESWESIEIPTASIRNDHVAVMEAQEGKHDDQLGYRLTIFASEKMRLHEGTEGSFITTRYTYWDKVT
jgi:hypothetical protein